MVIANPSGLVCDGCGVINADRFTLTTGQAVMNQGYLESFRVREGQVTIDGKGLNGSLTPFTDIYTRALKVNAGLYANELNTVLGQNDIQVKDQVAPKITATTGATSAPISNFALDVGQLGGMYAGKIFLVGTEQGLGVRNAGTINSTQGMLSLNANGDLVNTGNVIANKDQVQLKAQNVQNTGNVSSATSQISIESQNLDNTGLISSADELHLNQQNRLNNSGTLNAARVVIDATSLKNSGSIEQTGMQGLDLKSGSMTNLGGKIGIVKNTSGSGTGGSTGGTGSETAPSNPELADKSRARVPALATEGQAVCPQALVDERFRYYFIGNTLFGLINAMGATGVVTEHQLIEMLQSYLLQAYRRYPDSALLHTLLYQETFPYKGNLMTRVYELDELQAHISQQSIYVDLKNPLCVHSQVTEIEHA